MQHLSRRFFTIFFDLFCYHIPLACTILYPGKKSKMVMSNTVSVDVLVKPIQEVTLPDIPLKALMDADMACLLNIKTRCYPVAFRGHAYPKQAIEKYAGFRYSVLVGHAIADYLYACGRQYAASGNTGFMDNLNCIIEELALCRLKTNGYLVAIPNKEGVESKCRKLISVHPASI